MAAAPQMGDPMMTRRCAFCLGLLIIAAPFARASGYYVTVAGLGGEPQYEQEFTVLAQDLDKTFRSVPDAHVYALTGNNATRDHLRETLGAISHEAKPEDDFIFTFVGHGTFDGMEYKFNLVGPDISGSELGKLCDRIPAGRQLIVNTTDASGGSIAVLKHPGRAVIAATKNGMEKNATVFARYWVEALHDTVADLDKDGSESALETFQYAQRKTAEYYKAQKQLATEHAVFEDTGKNEPVREASVENGEGLFLSNFILLRLSLAANAANTPAKRALLAKKEELERRIDTLRYEKAAMSPEDYKQQLTTALVELARVQKDLDK